MKINITKFDAELKNAFIPFESVIDTYCATEGVVIRFLEIATSEQHTLAYERLSAHIAED